MDHSFWNRAWSDSQQAFSSDQKARHCRQVPSCPALRLRWLITQDVAAGGGSRVQRLLRHHFPFLYKNNIVPPRVLTAHQIPWTVFLPSSAYFYSFGYFILGLYKACFGPGETYCFISGCSALMQTLQLRSGRGEDVVLGFRFAGPCVCPEPWWTRSPGLASAPGGCPARKDRVQLRVGSEAPMTQASLPGGNIRTWLMITYF